MTLALVYKQKPIGKEVLMDLVSKYKFLGSFEALDTSARIEYAILVYALKELADKLER